VIFVPVPLLVFFFAVTMGVNHYQAENNHTAHRQNEDDRLILPDVANKFGYARIHAQQIYITSVKMAMLFAFFEVLVNFNKRS
jgi:hypothetical protein